MQEIASSIAKEYSLDVNSNILKGYPSLYNNEELTHRAIIYAKEYMGLTM